MKPLFLCCNILLHYRYTKMADKLVGTTITRFAMKQPLKAKNIFLWLN